MTGAFILLKTRQYIQGEIDLEALEDWLIPLLPVLFSLPDDDVVARLAGLIELGRAEMGSGVIQEDEFRASLRSFLSASLRA